MEPNQNQEPQNQPPEPTPQPAFEQPQPMPQPAAQPYAVPQENPGQTFGILSIVMIFVFPILGIVFGAMSRNKSKAANMPTGLGTAGLIINIIVTVIGFLVTILAIILIIAAGANSVDTSSGSSGSGSSGFGTSSSLKEDAYQVAKRAELYYIEAGDYPKTTTDFSKYSDSTLPSDIKVYSSLLLTNTSLTYIYCGAGAAQVVYLGNTKEDTHIQAVGSASSTQVCEKQL